MKKSMKKFMIACAAVSSIAIAAGMSAMAADITSSYDADSNSIPVATPDGVKDGSQMTVLVVPTDKKAAVTDADILYIDQNEKGQLPATALLKGESLGDGTYSVLVGYYDADETFKIAEDTFKIGAPAAETHTVLMGDVAAPYGTINAIDAQQVLAKSARKAVDYESNPDYKFAAKVTDPGNMTANPTAIDAQQILAKSARKATSSSVGKYAVVDAEYNLVELKDTLD